MSLDGAPIPYLVPWTTAYLSKKQILSALQMDFFEIEMWIQNNIMQSENVFDVRQPRRENKNPMTLFYSLRITHKS